MSRIPTPRMPKVSSMIVAPQPEAVDAGVNVLQAGGNAIDAVIACALTQGVVDPIMCGIGGFGVMQIFDPVSGQHIVYEGLGACPLESRADQWVDRYLGETTDGFGFILRDFVNEAGAMAVTAPPVLRLMETAHKQFGRSSWSSLFSEAITQAESGWIMRPHVYTVFTQNERKYGRMNYGEKLGLTEDGRRIYLESDGSYKKPGSIVRNPDLGRTLRQIAKEGAEVFYSGDLSKRIVDDVRANGGILSAEDLTGLKVPDSKPIEINYRGWRVCTPRPPAGGQFVAQVLKVLERFDLTTLKHNSPEYIRILCEAMKTALRDREEFIGDPNFVNNPLDHLLSDAYADEYADRIRSGEKTEIIRQVVSDSKHTTHVSAVDSNGLIVSFTHTLGNPSGFIVKDTGFMLNGAMSQFDPIPGRPNSIEPGKRRISSMAPTLVFDDQRPVVSIGAPGATWIGPAVAQVLVNVLDWGMEIQDAISAARVVSTSNAIDISNRIPRATQQALETLGYEVRRSHLSYAFAGVHGLTQFDGVIRGGADPQRDGYAAGV